jgi:hypothetical protein
MKNKITLSAQGRLLKVIAHGKKIGGRGRRKQVTEFSRSSRLRLLQKMATIKLEGGSKVIFVTLTYGTLFPTPKTAKRHLDSFLKRLLRRFPHASAIWRFEFQKRGAPHFHLMFFHLPYLNKRTLKRIWGDVIGKEFWDYSNDVPCRPFTRIEMLYGYRHAAAYMSKYVAKGVSDSGFNFTSYLTEGGYFLHPETDYCDGTIGRWWGVFNKQCLPIAHIETIQELFFQRKTFYDFMRAIRRSAKRRIGLNGGCARFVETPERWLKYWCYLSIA